MPAADTILGGFWQFYGNKKLSDVDIILAEEQPAAAAAAADGAAGEEPATTEDWEAAAGAAAPTAAAGEGKPGNPDGIPAEAATPTATTAARSSKRKRQEGEHIVGHSVVLAAFSGYCRTKLLDWDDATDATEQAASSSISRARHEIQLLVPAGQLEVGRLLVRGMYQQQPDLSGVTQAQLIQLLLLADRFEVPKVQAAVSAAIKALPPELLQWDTVSAVHSLPAGCAELAACQDLFSAAAAKLQQELGDLELALTEPDSSKEQQLLELPFGALKRLLQDERTRVSSENTVFWAIHHWFYRQQQQIKAKYSQWQQDQQLTSLRQQTQDLLQLVRMPQCSQLFIATVVGQWDLAVSCFTHHELLLASCYARSAGFQRQLPRDAANLPGFQRHPAWRLRARPPSAMTQLTIEWQLPLAELRDAFEEHLECSLGVGGTTGKERFWQGLCVYPRVEFSRQKKTRDGQSGPVRNLGFVCYAGLQQGEVRFAKTAFKAKSFLAGAADVKRCFESHQFTVFYDMCGPSSFVPLGAVDSWEAAEVVLRNKGLVGGDGCLHLSLTVSDVD